MAITRKFPKQVMIDITNDEAPEGFTIIEEGEWTQDHKYQSREIIFEHEGKFYSLDESRSGSPFTDWYYCSEDWDAEVEVTEVVKKEKTVFVWEAA